MAIERLEGRGRQSAVVEETRDARLELRAAQHEHREFARTVHALGSRLTYLIVADLEPEALQATSQIVSLSERRLRQTDPDGGQAA
jgi:hypothetical protein